LFSFFIHVLASGVPVSLFFTLEILVALSAPPPGLLHHDSLSLAVQTLGAAIEGAHWLNHFLVAFAKE
jgi:hypothetical protein